MLIVAITSMYCLAKIFFPSFRSRSRCLYCRSMWRLFLCCRRHVGRPELDLDMTREEINRRRLRYFSPTLADGLYDDEEHNEDVEQAIANIALEESLQNAQQQQQQHRDVSRRVNQERTDISQSMLSDIEAGSSPVPPSVDYVDPQGAQGGEMPSAISTLSDDISVLSEAESLIKQHHNSLQDVFTLRIDRSSIVDDLLAQYTEKRIAFCRVHVIMTGEQGLDRGGVTADMYTTFWSRVQELFFIGCERVVPELQAHRYAEAAKFRTLGRILSHSIAVMKTFPIPMCKSTIIAMIYDTTEVAAETLLEDFLYFLDDHERALVTSAINHYSSLTADQVEELAGLFERFNYGAMPTEDTYKHHVTQLARHVTCIRPRTLLELMRSGIPLPHFEHFWSKIHLQTLDVHFKAMRPTAKRVIARLKISDDQTDLSSRQTRVKGFLTDLLGEMTEPELQKFLHFVTGKKSIPRENITLVFTTQTGSMRFPKAHTCSNMLELPETYEDYDTFRSEFKHLLASDEAMQMTMA